MTVRTRGWIARVGLTLIWAIATTVIAFLVANQVASSDNDDDGALIAPPIAIDDRQTTALAPQTIQPVLSGEGTVIADGAGWMIEAPVSPRALAYQLIDAPVSVKALIVGGPFGFDCPWIGLGQGADGGVTMRCRIPADVRVVAGLSGTMVLTLSPPIEAHSLPVAAVVGTAGQGEVIVVALDGSTSARPVTIGAVDTFWVEITSGLSEGERVLVSPVQADFAAGAR